MEAKYKNLDNYMFLMNILVFKVFILRLNTNLNICYIPERMTVLVYVYILFWYCKVNQTNFPNDIA